MTTFPVRRTLAALPLFLGLLFVLSPAVSAQTADVTIISDTRNQNVSRNDEYRVRFTVENTGTTEIRGGVFVEFDVPGGGTVVRRVENTVLRAGETKTFRFKERIRSNSPSGQYNTRVSFESIDRTTVYDMATTTFTVSGDN